MGNQRAADPLIHLAALLEGGVAGDQARGTSLVCVFTNADLCAFEEEMLQTSKVVVDCRNNAESRESVDDLVCAICSIPAAVKGVLQFWMHISTKAN